MNPRFDALRLSAARLAGLLRSAARCAGSLRSGERRAGFMLSAALVVGVSGCGPDAAEPATETAPLNVLFVSLDTLRADHLEAYGYTRETAPNLRALAEQGVLFEDCVATANWTLPTHTSLFTGLSALTHGVEEASDLLPEACPTLVEPFRDAGYATAGFYSNPFLGEKFGYARGFDEYARAATDDDLRAMIERKGDAKGSTSGTRFPEPGARESDYFAEQSSEQVTARGLAFLDQLPSEQPFFLFLHYNDIHSDYIPPAPHDRLFDTDYNGTLSPEHYPAHPDVHAEMNERDLAWIRALYDGEIHWVDEQLARVFQALEEIGRAEDTLVVVTADHGEGFFERGYKEHHYGLYRELLHVPFILRLPRALPSGRRVSDTVSQADIAPTILSLAGLTGLPGADGRALDELAAGTAEHSARPPVVSSAVLKPILDQPGDEMVSLTTGDFHAVLRRRHTDGRETLQVFDRRSDPEELSPLAPGPQTEAAGRALRSAVEAMEARRGLLPWAGGDNTQPIDPAILERMKGWGYIK
ncbi:MAG: hypothetical protein DHS20C15_19240 [Planctomycetota bacterium]|nr:MAG: hypothetical protein DHS20C15_19240 [Planctomycetota bacterium]